MRAVRQLRMPNGLRSAFEAAFQHVAAGEYRLELRDTGSVAKTFEVEVHAGKNTLNGRSTLRAGSS